MKKERILAISAAVLTLATSAWAQGLTNEVRTTYDRFRTAVEKFDSAAVTKMIEPGFQLKMPGGQLISRAAYLQGLEDRRSISTETAKHRFVISRVRENNGLVSANVVLTLTSKFRDGNQGLHSLKITEHKIIRLRRVDRALKMASIEATEVRTSIDGKTATVVKRK